MTVSNKEANEPTNKLTIQLAHSPDADDAFMFYGLREGLVDSGNIEFTHILSDIETLNHKARQGEYELTALSVHAYAYVCDRYDILRHGASIGDGYGPLLVARKSLKPDTLANLTIAIPGKMTTAYLALCLFDKTLKTVEYPFDQIVPAVERGMVDVGLIIHEGQLTYSHSGLQKVLDLGQWWKEKTGLPLPLGVNGIRKDLPLALQKEIARLLKESIVYGLEHRKKGLDHALKFARGVDPKLADQFVGMYVNEETVEMSERSIRGIKLLLDMAFENGLIPKKVNPIYI